MTRATHYTKSWRGFVTNFQMYSIFSYIPAYVGHSDIPWMTLKPI